MRFSSSRLFLAGSALAGVCLSLPFTVEATMPPPTGRIPRAVADFERRLSATFLPCRPDAEGGIPQTVWRIPVVLAAFTGPEGDLTYGAADFDTTLFDPTGSVRDYYLWASGGRVQVTGQVVGVVRLPGSLAYYGDGNWGLSGRPLTSVYGAVKDGLRIVDGSEPRVDWSEFDVNQDGAVDVLWFVHAGKGGEASPNDDRRLWSITDCLTRDPAPNALPFKTSQLVDGSTTQYYTINLFSSLPEISGINPTVRSEIGVYCHEFGHALGLPDLYDTSVLGDVANVGPGNWSLMSTGAYGGNGLQPELPSHPGGWAALRLGWTESVRPTRDTTLVLPPLTSGGPVVEFWFQGESHPEHFLLENRVRQSFDVSLWKSGMIITHLDDELIEARLPGNAVNKAGSNPALVLVEGDGDGDLLVGRNHADRFDPFPGDSLRTRFDDGTRPGTRTFGNAVTNISLRDIEQVGNTIRMNLQVVAPGWLPVEDHTDPLFQPLASPAAGNLAVVEPGGEINTVTCEIRAGRPQVMLHRRTAAGWEPGVDLSASPTAALTPAIATLPGGNAAVVWSDTRGGRSRIWVRVRLEDEWSPGRVLADVPGQNQSPAIGADAHGRVYVVWLNTLNGAPRLYFTRFVYFAPFGQPIPVTAADRQPGNPAIAVDEDGISYIMWPDAADNPQRFWFARFNPDSGLAQPQTLTATAGAETGISALVDTAGTLHLAWQVSPAGRSEIHYQQRFKTRRPAPRDTSVVKSQVPVGNPRLGMDPSGSLHLVYETANGAATQIYYKRWRPGWGWDFQGTEVSAVADGNAGAPQVLAESAGNVSVLFTSYGSNGTRFMERRRALDPPAQPAPGPVAAAQPAPLSVRPNPMRAGQEFELDWTGAAPGPGATAELFDLAGRRVASAALLPHGTAWRARFSAALMSRLASGVYFVRAGIPGTPARRLVILR